MLFALLAICGLGSLVCWILVLIKIFQSGNIGLGIVGIICGIVAFVYGWMNADEYRIRNIMIIWTVLILAEIVLQVMMPHNAVVVTR